MTGVNGKIFMTTTAGTGIAMKTGIARNTGTAGTAIAMKTGGLNTEKKNHLSDLECHTISRY